MLSTSQIDTVSGIVCNYDYYVVYYYADYHDYQVGELRDSRIEIYVGSDITAEGNTFFFGNDVECYYLTNSKYLSRHDCSSQFTVKDSEIVYTNCISSYPDLCYFESKLNNIDVGKYLSFILLVIISSFVICRVIFGGSR